MPINKSIGVVVLVATLATAALTLAAFRTSELSEPEQSRPHQVMLILRGIANAENPRGQLDDGSALEYARRVGFQGEVLDVAGEAGPESPQLRMALERIRRDETISAIYGFSGGGYNARLIWGELTPGERGRIHKLVVVGSPGATEADFAGCSDVLIKPDPPEGHLAGPQALLESLGPEASKAKPAD